MSMSVNFETDESFQIGNEGFPKYVIYPSYNIINQPPTYWQRGGWYWTQDPAWAKVEPELNIVRSGQRSCKLWLRDNVTNDGRIELLHDYDVFQDVDLWNEVWYYLPSNVFHESVIGGAAIHRIIYERLWATDRIQQYQKMNINVALWHDSRAGAVGQWMFLLGFLGSFDNNNDGIPDTFWRKDLYSNDPVYPTSESWNLQKILVPFNRWFKIKSRVIRNLSNHTDGKIQIGINLNDGQGDRMLWNLYNGAPPTGGGTAFPETRTIGINPEIMSQYPSYNPGYAGTPPSSYGYLSGGVGLYTKALDPGAFIYIDDITITRGKFAPTPIPYVSMAASAAGIALSVLGSII